jgi:anti-sigma factor RsiW
MHKETDPMSRTQKPAGDSEEFESGRALWRRCQSADAAIEEGARFLDLAAFAEGLLDEDEHDRVAASLATDPGAAGDIAAARALVSGLGAPPAGVEGIISHASALVPETPSKPAPVLPFRTLSARRRLLPALAQWGSLAAAIVVASWLGFAMGSGVSLQLSQPSQQSQVGVDTLLPELLDPATGFLRDFGGGQQT